MIYSLFVSCPRGLEYLLEEELNALGLMVTKVSPQGVYGEASLEILYRLCLWSRIANRVQLILCQGPVADEKMLYRLCREFNWQQVFHLDKSFAVEFHGQSEFIRNTMFGALLVKDAIVDYFRELHGERPVVDKNKPQILIHAYLKKEELTVSFDLTGYSLHQRGYRLEAGIAPLKENVACALLMRAQWPTLLQENYALQDLFCGSGTILIEAAMMATNRAPGLLRDDQSFQDWQQHQPQLWAHLKVTAKAAIQPFSGVLVGSDHDKKMIEIARANAERAGVAEFVQFKQQDMSQAQALAEKGIVVSNPPYGERLGENTELLDTYQTLGKILHAHFQGWQAAILLSEPLLAKAMGLRAQKQYRIFNGALECKLYTFFLEANNELKAFSSPVLSDAAKMLLNRLQKNYRHLQKWAQKNYISCYRLYDADLPEYAFAVDIYNEYAVLQEYAPPSSVPEHKAQKRSLDMLQVLPQVLGIPAKNLIVKQRKQQKGQAQYEKITSRQQMMEVSEGRAKFKVNLYDYLDTGLFLDHRPLRLRFSTLAPGLRFLNCFCYTGTASVHAALAGALTTNVDLSNTYLNWAQENFKLNRLDLARHQFIQYDCLEWLRRTRDRFDVIFLDPPSFSNSKRMSDTLDIQRDHQSLIQSAMHLLNPDGVLYFSTNLRQFKLDEALKEKYLLRDMSAQTLDQDFKRNPKIHYCFAFKNQGWDF